MTDIILKQGTGVPSDSDLEVAEVAIDSSSGAMYTKLADGSVKHLNPKGGSAAGGLSGEWEYSNSASAGKFTSRNQDWYTATTFSFHNTDAVGGKHTLALVGEGDVIVLGSEDGLKGAEYRVLSVAPNLDVYTFTVDPISFFGQFFSDREMVNADFVPQLGGSSLWEQNGDDIYYDEGNVGIGTDSPLAAIHIEGTDALSSQVYMTRDSEAGGYYLHSTGEMVANFKGYKWQDLTGSTSLTIDSAGNVGIGTDSPVFSLDVQSSNGTMRNRSSTDTAVIRNQSAGGNYTKFETSNSGQIDVKQNETARLTIDSTGNVGIGMSPLRSTAKEQLAEWKSRFDERLKADPKADKKAATLEITDDAFEVLPTEEAVAEWMETRAAGDRLQVNGTGYFSRSNVPSQGIQLHSSVAGNIIDGHGDNKTMTIRNLDDTDGGILFRHGTSDTKSLELRNGDAYFSGTVSAGEVTIINQGIYRKSMAGLWFGPSHVVGMDGNGSSTDGVTDLGAQYNKFKDAYFSGTVEAGGFTVNGQPISSNDPRISDANISNWNTAFGWGNHATAGYATQTWVNNQGFAKGSFVPTSGNTTISGTLTATDFVASSDERLKDNITTAPAGLIDSLKGREWDWKESGEKGSGVVAQELEQVLPHLVHTDDEGMKSVAYNGLVAYLIEEVKALRAEVEALKS